MTENLESYCRICLDLKLNHVSILENSIIDLHIKSCLAINVSINDDLPKFVCVSCVNKLGEFYDFQLNARCSQYWLESSLLEKKKSTEIKMSVQPLPDSEYNSDSLLEFLNNTANIEEYLNGLGKEDIPSIVNMLDKQNDASLDSDTKIPNNIKNIKTLSPKKKLNHQEFNMEIDVLDSELDIVKELLIKEYEPKTKQILLTTEKKNSKCFACKVEFNNVQKLSEHLDTCDSAIRTCIHCNVMFDSKRKMLQHFVSHKTGPVLTCNCGDQFNIKEKLLLHYRTCQADYKMSVDCVFHCKECGQTCDDRFLLYQHAKQHVLKSKCKICDICGNSFNGSESLNKHRVHEHEIPVNLMYRCRICSYTCSNHKEIYVHVRKHTTKSKSNSHRHLCEWCGCSFATHTTLMRHSAKHGNLGHKCSICDQRFADDKARNEHVLAHEETIMCDQCGENLNSFKFSTHSCRS